MSNNNLINNLINDIATDTDVENRVAGKILDATRILNEDDMVTSSLVATVTQSSLINYIKNQLAGGVSYRGTLMLPVTFDGTTSNSYLNNATDVLKGDLFVASSSGILTLSDGDISVSNGDAIIVNSDSPKSSTTKAMIDDISPTYPIANIGEYKEIASNNNIGTSWLLCDGSAVSRTQYQLLFNVINVDFGAGDGTTTFNLPDRRGRVGIMSGQGTGLTDRTTGQIIGEEDVTLINSQLPTHAHSIDHNHPSVNSSSNGSHNHTVSVPYKQQDAPYGNKDRTVWEFVNNVTRTTNTEPDHNHSVNLPNYTGNSGDTGANQSHNNLQPSLVTGYYFIYTGA